MKRCIGLIVLLVFWTSIGDCAAQTLTIIDMAGRNVTAPLNPDRIVCLGPGTLRLIVYLKAENKLAGVEAMEKNSPRGRPYWLAHPELHSLPICGPGGVVAINQKPPMETMLHLAPEVIFVTYMEAALADHIQRLLRIPVVVLSYGAFSTFDETVYQALRIAAVILDRSQRAEEVIATIESLRCDLHRRTAGAAGQQRPRVYVGGIGYRSVQGIESTQQHYPPAVWVNAENVAGEIASHSSGHISLTKEALLTLDPDIIFIDAAGLPLVADDLARNSGFYKGLKAFSRRRVYILHPFNWYTTNIDTALANAYAMGKILYGKQFEDIDPERKADEIYTALVGRPVYVDMKADYGPIGRSAPFLD
jgi:iron complex transport system substrate-binding protein